MSAVGAFSGELILRIGGQDLNLGRIEIPIVARVRARADSGSPEIAIGLRADLVQIRETVAAILGGGAK